MAVRKILLQTSLMFCSKIG